MINDEYTNVINPIMFFWWIIKFKLTWVASYEVID